MRQETRFKEKVFRIVQKIPRGNFLTYKQVAERAGYPKAWRAVGNILNKNRNLYPPKFSKKTLAGKKIPCHRVIRSDGKIGGFNEGTKKKAYLLKKEGVILKSRGNVLCQFRKN
jgi:O6-methylguanine-DNA--protein-cysteine methyltransferase